MILWYAVAIAILALVLWDAFITVFSTQGAGPLTGFWTRHLWGLLLRIHRRRPIHSALAYYGPLTVLGNVVAWYALLNLGWWLIFAADPESVMHNSTMTPVGPLKKLYFVGSTTSSVGYGDLVPNGFPWTAISTTSAFTATVVVTLSLSYVLSVLSAAVERKTLAQGVFAIASDTESFYGRVFKPGQVMDSQLLTLANQINRHANQHLAYPVLHYFHSERPEASPSCAMLMLSDAAFLERNVNPYKQGATEGLLIYVDGCLNNYLTHGSLNLGAVAELDEQVCQHQLATLKDQAKRLGLPPQHAQAFEDALADYGPRRKRMLAMCVADGWQASSAASSPQTNQTLAADSA